MEQVRAEQPGLAIVTAENIAITHKTPAFSLEKVGV